MKLKYCDETWNVLDDEECEALTSAELLAAIWDFDLSVYRRPDGSLTTAHIDDHSEYELIDDDR